MTHVDLLSAASRPSKHASTPRGRSFWS